MKQERSKIKGDTVKANDKFKAKKDPALGGLLGVQMGRVNVYYGEQNSVKSPAWLAWLKF
ncbi:hypothetical protein R50073_30530 [Maricurvus nonylphenolicus]